MNSTAVRLGGLCGIGAAATAIPAYVVGSPELPNTPEKLKGYYARAESFIAANGTIPLAHLFTGIVPIAVLVVVLPPEASPEAKPPASTAATVPAVDAPVLKPDAATVVAPSPSEASGEERST